MSTIRIHAVVRGLVQGVSYRASTAETAQRLGLVGWVRNCADGSVELEAEGPRDVVDRLVAWCHEGPPLADVQEVVTSERAPHGDEHAFAVRR